MKSATTTPNTPSGGGVAYVNSGALTYMGTGGVARTVVAADGTVPAPNETTASNATATGAVTEDAPQSSVSGQLSKLDVDTTDTHTWSLSNGGKGTYGSFVVDATGKWTYSLNNADAKVQALAAGQQVQDSITVTINDGHGGTASALVSITVKAHKDGDGCDSNNHDGKHEHSSDGQDHIDHESLSKKS